MHINTSMYQNITKCNVAIKPSLLNGLFWDIVTLLEEILIYVNIEYEIYHGKCRKMIVIPLVSTDKIFNKLGGKQLNKLYKNIISDSYCEHKCTREGKDIEEIRQEEQ